jgi:hypothetical protein
MKMRGCVNGSPLTSVQNDPVTVAGALTASNRYRMVGSKEIRTQLKKANGKMVDVTGRINTSRRTLVKGKRMGPGHHLSDGTASRLGCDHRSGLAGDRRRQRSRVLNDQMDFYFLGWHSHIFPLGMILLMLPVVTGLIALTLIRRRKCGRLQHFEQLD